MGTILAEVLELEKQMTEPPVEASVEAAGREAGWAILNRDDDKLLTSHWN